MSSSGFAAALANPASISGTETKLSRFDRPSYSGFSTNYARTSGVGLTLFMSQHPDVQHIRVGLEGIVPNYYSAWNWAHTNMDWLNSLFSSSLHPWMNTAHYAWMISNASSETGAGITMWNSNTHRDRIKNIPIQLAGHYDFPTTGSGFVGFGVTTNEPDNTGDDGAGTGLWYNENGAVTDVNELLNRVLFVAKSSSDGWTGTGQQGLRFGPIAAFPSLTKNPSEPAQLWSLRDLFNKTYNGPYTAYAGTKFLDLVDVVSVHMHRVATRIPTFDGVAPSATLPSWYNLWTALEEQGSAKPVMTDECGMPLGIASGGPYNEGGRTDHSFLREIRTGIALQSAYMHGVSLWIWYSTAGTGAAADYDLLNENSTFTKYAEADPIFNLFDPSDLAKPNPVNNVSTLPITNKTWTTFHKGGNSAGWAVWVDALATPDYATGSPWRLWRKVTLDNNLATIDNSLGSVDRIMLLRPVQFTSGAGGGGSHYFQADIKIAGSTTTNPARVKLRVKGFNAKHGLNEVASSIVSGNTGGAWVTVNTAAFIPIQHGLAGLPDPLKAELVIDYDGNGGTGTVVSIRNTKLIKGTP